MTQHILSTKWFPNPIQIYKNEKRKQVLYKELKTHTRVAVEVIKPKRPNHVQSMSCDMKEWAVWRELRNVLNELDELEESKN